MTTETHFTEGGSSPPPAEARDAETATSRNSGLERPASLPAPKPASGPAPACQGETKEGRPCGGTPTAESGLRWCPWHDPRYTAEEKRLWARRGAVANVQRGLAAKVAAEAADLAPDLPSLGTAADVRRYVEHIAHKAETGQLNPSMVTAIKGLIDSAIRLGELEIERALLDQDMADARQPQRPAIRVIPS
jgi:hypothetical protein